MLHSAFPSWVSSYLCFLTPKVQGDNNALSFISKTIFVFFFFKYIKSWLLCLSRTVNHDRVQVIIVHKWWLLSISENVSELSVLSYCLFICISFSFPTWVWVVVSSPRGGTIHSIISIVWESRLTQYLPAIAAHNKLVLIKIIW